MRLICYGVIVGWLGLAAIITVQLGPEPRRYPLIVEELPWDYGLSIKLAPQEDTP